MQTVVSAVPAAHASIAAAYLSMGPDERTLSGRLRATTQPRASSAAGVGIDAQQAARYDEWCRLAADGDAAAFARRLQWDGIDQRAARVALASDGANDAPPSSFVQAMLAEAERATHAPLSALQPVVLADDPRPFEELLLPAVSVGLRQLAARADDNDAVRAGLQLLSDGAADAFARQLLAELSTVYAPSLMAAFDGERPAGHRLLLALAPTAVPPATRERYTNFVQRMLSGGLRALLAQRPALADLTARLVGNWVDNVAEFLARLAADWQQLLQTFVPASTPAARNAVRVEALLTDLSDRHHGGRTVFGVQLTCAVAVAYKPRPVAAEAAFNDLLKWCNATQALLSMRVLQVLDRESYGWVEWVTHAPAADQLAVQRFYERAGMLLCAVHLLWGTDCHRENLIAEGEHPVLIDAETLCHHDLSPDIFGLPATGATSVDLSFRYSVLRTGMLPRWDMNAPGERGVDVSGLAGHREDALEPVLSWQHVNTDFMRLHAVSVNPGRLPNQPYLPASDVSPDDYVSSIRSGFARLYHLAMARRGELLAAAGPLTRFEDIAARFVLRPTMVYHQLLLASLEPMRMLEGIDRSLAFEPLARSLLGAPEAPLAWPLLAAEIAALERFDVPYFYGRNAERRLYGEGVSADKFFEVPSIERVRGRVQALCEQDLQLQCELIQGAFDARRTSHPDARSFRPAADRVADRVADTDVPDAQMLVAAALKVADELSERALRTGSGGATWIGLARHSASERYQLQPLGADLYSGAPGVALFLAAAATADASRGYAELARAALLSVCDALASDSHVLVARWLKGIGVGGCAGLGSIVYALSRVSSLLGDRALLASAQSAAALLSPALIARDRVFDVFGGSAGAILGLLSLHALTHEPALLDSARLCAAHLLTNRVPTSSGHHAWKSVAPAPLTGFAHGAAGIAYALLRLDSVDADVRLRCAAADAIAFERAVYLPAIAVPPDECTEGGRMHPWYMLNWCHGAAGIGLSRLGMPGVLATDSIADADAAVCAVQAWGVQEIDHLCCGNAGRSELLLLSAARHGRDDLRAEAGRRAGWMIARAEANGGFSLFPNLPDRVFSPGLFQGTAGIGYHLLRLVDASLPSVLLLN